MTVANESHAIGVAHTLNSSFVKVSNAVQSVGLPSKRDHTVLAAFEGMVSNLHWIAINHRTAIKHESNEIRNKELMQKAANTTEMNQVRKGVTLRTMSEHRADSAVNRHRAGKS